MTTITTASGFLNENVPTVIDNYEGDYFSPAPFTFIITSLGNEIYNIQIPKNNSRFTYNTRTRQITNVVGLVSPNGSGDIISLIILRSDILTSELYTLDFGPIGNSIMITVARPKSPGLNYF